MDTTTMPSRIELLQQIGDLANLQRSAGWQVFMQMLQAQAEMAFVGMQKETDAAKLVRHVDMYTIALNYAKWPEAQAKLLTQFLDEQEAAAKDTAKVAKK